MARPSNWPWIPPFQGGELEFESPAGHHKEWEVPLSRDSERILPPSVSTPSDCLCMQSLY